MKNRIDAQYLNDGRRWMERPAGYSVKAVNNPSRVPTADGGCSGGYPHEGRVGRIHSRNVKLGVMNLRISGAQCKRCGKWFVLEF